VLMFGCGVALAYSFLVFLTAASLWFLRSQSLFEMWWLFTSLMRYPREIFVGSASPMGLFFTFVVPILLVVNVPSRVMVKVLDTPAVIGFTLLAAAVLLWASRRFFRYALRRYRSASS